MLAETPNVRGTLLELRALLHGKRVRADVPDESIFRRRIPGVRPPRDTDVGSGAGEAKRSHDLHIPAYHQVHLPQVRPHRDDTDARLPVRAAPQHRQREDVHTDLVLVHGAGRIAVRPASLSAVPVRLSGLATATPQHQPQGLFAPGRGPRHQQHGRGRLVGVVHAGQKFRSDRLQRNRRRSGQTDGGSGQHRPLKTAVAAHQPPLIFPLHFRDTSTYCGYGHAGRAVHPSTMYTMD